MSSALSNQLVWASTARLGELISMDDRFHPRVLENQVIILLPLDYEPSAKALVFLGLDVETINWVRKILEKSSKEWIEWLGSLLNQSNVVAATLPTNILHLIMLIMQVCEVMIFILSLSQSSGLASHPLNATLLD
ncbi:hypothetical protein GmHk_20G057221 [Glycine max]|nr:hypothetical protein GmHk_20G057221 [Glycine max]